MTVADDLSTLRETVWEIAGCGDIRFSHDIDRAKAEHEAALDRVEAEIARLTESREKERRLVDEWTGEAATQRERAEAAEAEIARLQGRVYALETSLPENYMETLRATEAEAARLRDGLRFYANEDSYLWHGEERGTIQKNDRGARARALLDEDGAA